MFFFLCLSPLSTSSNNTFKEALINVHNSKKSTKSSTKN